MPHAGEQDLFPKIRNVRLQAADCGPGELHNSVTSPAM
jgi:hypothetical protein